MEEIGAKHGRNSWASEGRFVFFWWGDTGSRGRKWQGNPCPRTKGCFTLPAQCPAPRPLGLANRPQQQGPCKLDGVDVGWQCTSQKKTQLTLPELCILSKGQIELKCLCLPLRSGDKHLAAHGELVDRSQCVLRLQLPLLAHLHSKR